MKTKLLLVITVLFTLNIHSQNYTFTLVQNSTYNYTVAAVPDFSSVGGTTEPFTLESMIVTIMLPDDGVNPALIDEGTIIFHYLSLDSVSTYTAENLDSADPGYDRSANIVAAPSGSALLPAHTVGELIPLITFDITGSVTNGVISILANDDPLAIAANNISPNFFDSFFSVDDDGNAGANSPTDLYVGQSGTTSYSFSTLSVVSNSLVTTSVYPNPVKNKVTIVLQDNATYTLLDINGRLVKKGELLEGNTHLNLSKLSNGVYVLKLKTDNHITIKKIIKE